MNTVSAFIFCILLGLNQGQSFVPNSTTPPILAEVVTDPATSLISNVATQSSVGLENVTVTVSEIPSESEINEVLTFGDNVIFVVSERLPSLSEEVKSVGEKILADTRDGVQSCEKDLRQNGTIWEYKVCCSSYLRYAMSAFAGLAQNSIRSGAARPTLFFM